MIKKEKLALYGGKPIRKKTFPQRFAYNNQEKKIVDSLFNYAIVSGKAIRYSEKYEREYEKKFSKFMGGGFCDLVNSGTNALLCSVAALDLEGYVISDKEYDFFALTGLKEMLEKHGLLSDTLWNDFLSSSLSSIVDS